MKLYNYNCTEVSSVDLRQANAVLRKVPDVIFFEAPSKLNHPASFFNQFPPDKKPQSELQASIACLRKISKEYPWVASEIYVYKNIAHLWKQGHDIKLYSIDAPSDLLQVDSGIKNKLNPKPERRGTYLKWWVRMYLRERIMTMYMKKLLLKHSENSIGLVFLQKFHWLNVQFQLNNPTNNEVYNYYFGKFKKICKNTIKKEVYNFKDDTLTSYWKRFAQF